VDAIIIAARQQLPGLGHRSLTYDDFLAYCRAQGVLVDVRASLFDSPPVAPPRRIT